VITDKNTNLPIQDQKPRLKILSPESVQGRRKRPALKSIVRGRTPCPSEHQEQAAFFRWLEFLFKAEKDPRYLLAYAIPNGGSRGGKGESGKLEAMITGKKLKEEGVKEGVPDVCWPVARYPFHGLYIEFKRQHGGTVSPEQRHYINSLLNEGYLAVAVKGCDAAVKVFDLYRMLPAWCAVVKAPVGCNRETVTGNIFASCGKGVLT